jgi:ubiquitin carboxyl-terminal hydrolase 9/24
MKIIDFITPHIINGDWRTKNNRDWNIIPKFNEKSPTGYVGLKNLGCS